jgi:hypothetical protein
MKIIKLDESLIKTYNTLIDSKVLTENQKIYINIFEEVLTEINQSKDSSINKHFNQTKLIPTICKGSKIDKLLKLTKLPILTKEQFAKEFCKLMDTRLSILFTVNAAQYLIRPIEENKKNLIFCYKTTNDPSDIINYIISDFGIKINSIKKLIDTYDDEIKNALNLNYIDIKHSVVLILNHAAELGFFSNDQQEFCLIKVSEFLFGYNCEIVSELLVQETIRQFDQKKYSKAFEILSKDLEISPKSDEKLYFMIGIVEAVFKEGNSEMALKLIAEISNLYPHRKNMILNHKSINEISNFYINNHNLDIKREIFGIQDEINDTLGDVLSRIGKNFSIVPSLLDTQYQNSISVENIMDQTSIDLNIAKKYSANGTNKLKSSTTTTINEILKENDSLEVQIANLSIDQQSAINELMEEGDSAPQDIDDLIQFYESSRQEVKKQIDLNLLRIKELIIYNN